MKAGTGARNSTRNRCCFCRTASARISGLGDTKSTLKRKARRVVYVFAPFVLLLLCVGSINIVPGLLTAVDERQTTPISSAPPPASATTASQSAITSTPTAQPTVQATATPIPTIPADAIITLLGPPAGSTFAEAHLVTFYWSWPLPLTDGQQFVVYAANGGETYQLGTVAEPNLGTNYQLTVALGERLGGSGQFQWQTRLETAVSNLVLATSENRNIRLTNTP